MLTNTSALLPEQKKPLHTTTCYRGCMSRKKKTEK